MTRKYAIFFLLPFEKQTLCVYETNSIARFEVGHLLNSNDDLVCLNYDDYLCTVTRVDNIPLQIFDINVAVRMLNGFPASKFNNENAPWKGLSCLGRHLGNAPLYKAIRAIEKGKFGNYGDWISSLPTGWERQILDALKQEHIRLTTELDKEKLLSQFIDVDMMLKSMFTKIGIQGISINRTKLQSKYEELDREYYKSVKTLENTFNFTVDSWRRKLSFADIKDFLDGYNPEDFSEKYFWESIELMEESSEFLRCLSIEHRDRIDMSELLRINSSISDKCRIEYDVFGTVTGRILLTRPGLQNLKRTSRDIISPKSDFDFVYADYKQFEPGILASFSCDAKLIDLYNKGDIYMGLAKSISDACARKVAKEVFLSFVYGMTKENIRKRIVRKFGEESGNAVDSFFGQFSMVNEWKSKIVEAAKINRFVKGPFSYLRRISPEDTDRDIARWAPNHFIQSTASGIFKKALCKIAVQLKDCRMLVPMHDAILLECPKTQTGEVRKKLEKIMVGCFQEVCPKINIGISFEPFAYDKVN